MGVWIATSLLVLSWADNAPPGPPTKHEVAETVRHLGDEDFAAREAAMRRVWELGDDAVEALTAAKEGDDPEIRYRATLLLKQIALGIRPDMPADLARHIEQYRTGDRVAKRHAVVALEARGEIGLLLKFFRQESDDYVKQQLRDSIVRHAQEMLPALVVRQRFSDAEELLIAAREIQPNPDATLSLARFYWSTGQVDAGIARLSGKGDEPPAARHLPDLACLYALKADWKNAAAYAEKSGNASQVAAFRLASQDYAALVAAPPALGTDTDVVVLKAKSADALLWRLAGDNGRAATALEQFVALRNSPAMLRDAERTEDAKAKALLKLNRIWSTRMLILEQFDQAFAALAEDDPILLAVLRIRRQEYFELAKFLKWDSATPFDDAWLNSLPIKPDLPRETQFDLAILSARALAVAGRRHDVRRILDTLSRNPLPNRSNGLQHMLLAYAALEGDDWERFLDYSVIAREELAASTFWERLAPQQAALARAWDAIFEQKAPLEQAAIRERITQVAQLSGVRNAPRIASSDLDKLLADAEGAIAALPASSRPPRVKLVAETALRHGRREQAAKLFEQIASDDPSAAMYLGDLAAADKRGEDSAKWYAAAWEATVTKTRSTAPKPAPVRVPRRDAAAEDDPFGEVPVRRRGRRVVEEEEVIEVDEEIAVDRATLPQVSRDRNALLAMYLRGKYTPGDKGEQYRRLALALMPSTELYLAMADTLQQRGYREDAQSIHAMLTCVAPLGSVTHANAVSHLASSADGSERGFEAVAQRWEQARVMSLLAGATYTQAESYCDLPRARHLARARAALTATPVEEAEYPDAVASIERASPADMRTYETLLPTLIEKGMREEAVKLFDRNYAFYRRLADEYPNSPHFANQLAWLCAISHQKLDEAQKLAELAVKVDPDQAAYIDTLAEVFFQRGNRDRAVELSKKTLDLAPNSAEMKRRLKHFQDDPLPQ